MTLSAFGSLIGYVSLHPLRLARHPLLPPPQLLPLPLLLCSGIVV
uniref:Uncharacterized protein n=1 Tax=Arundo donax TaxID=35708 RepID=A0A0A9DT57_ARUDO